MRIIITLIISLFFVSTCFAQITGNVPERNDSKLDKVIKILGESEKPVTEKRVQGILDSLDQAEIIERNEKRISYKVNSKGDTVYSAGDRAYGGIVFWVDKNGARGLVASEEDLASEVYPYYAGEKFRGKTYALKGDSVSAGKFNTTQIIVNKSPGYDAARICINYRGGGFDDWYLPSVYELNLLYRVYTRRIVGNFARDYYWSSSEDINDVAWLVRFYDGAMHNYKKYGSTAFRVRAIRVF